MHSGRGRFWPSGPRTPKSYLEFLALALRGEWVTPMWLWVLLLPARTSLRDGISRQTDTNSALSLPGCMTWASGLTCLTSVSSSGKSLSFLIWKKRTIPHSEGCFKDSLEIGTLFNYRPIVGNRNGFF